MCCKLLSVPEAGKPDDGWCPHCRPGRGGCAIYQDRPAICRGYSCHWLAGSLPDHWYPLKCKMVVDMIEKDDALVQRVHVDPRQPLRWREEPYYSEIKESALRGLRGELVKDRMVFTVISLGQNKWTVVLPHEERPYKKGMVILRTGENEFKAFDAA